MARFSNKTILITGGTSGMGLAGALRVSSEGARVIVTGKNPERLGAAKKLLPTDSLILENDSAISSSAESLAEAVSTIGSLDGLWLNAAIASIGPIESIDAEGFDLLMHVNVRAPFLQLAKLSPLLREGASVVVTTSSSVYEGAAMTSLYAATKGAIVAAVRSWATALAPRGIRVNALVPGPIETNFRHFLPKETRESFETSVVNDVPLGRIGRAEEAAAVALFLLSDDASYVTGSQYAVDGGLILR